MSQSDREGNPKAEIRIPKEIRNLKNPKKSKLDVLERLPLPSTAIRISFFGLLSDLGFRPSDLNHHALNANVCPISLQPMRSLSIAACSRSMGSTVPSCPSRNVLKCTGRK